MQVITSWTGRQADALRQALRMTNESFAEHLGVSVRTVANWRKRPEIRPQPGMQELLDVALERAPDRIKAQFSQLAGEECCATDNQPTFQTEPFALSLYAMTSREWDRDDARALSQSFDAALERSAVDDIERLAHVWLIFEPPQVIELSAGRRVSDALITAVEHRVVQLRRADDFITGSASRDLVRNEQEATIHLLSEAALTDDQAKRVLTATGELAQLGAWVAADAGLVDEAAR